MIANIFSVFSVFWFLLVVYITLKRKSLRCE